MAERAVVSTSKRSTLNSPPNGTVIPDPFADIDPDDLESEGLSPSDRDLSGGTPVYGEQIDPNKIIRVERKR
jgi:hypothetical protein